MRGFKSKEASLLKMIKKVKPSTVVMNETLLSGRAKVSVSPYTCWSRNRKETGGGGGNCYCCITSIQGLHNRGWGGGRR